MTLRQTRIAAALALLVGGGSLIAVVATPADDQYEVTAVFEQAHGLVRNGRVWAGGAAVGTIKRIALGRDGLPHVTMRIDSSYRLRGGATADLRLISNSGELNRVVVLTRGSGSPLGNGAVIAAERTDEPVELDDVLAGLTPQVRADVRYVTARLDGATTGLDEAFRATLRHSGRALRESGRLLAAVSDDGDSLTTLVREGNVVAAAFARDRDALGAAVTQTSELMQTAAGRQAQIRDAVDELAAGLRAPRLALDELRATVPRLGRVVDQTLPPARQLAPTSKLLASTLRGARPALRDLAATARDAPRDLKALTPLLQVAAPVARRLAPTLRDALQPLDVLRVYTPELTGFLGGWTGIGSSYDAAGHGIRFASTLTPAPNRRVSPDTVEPGFIDAPFLRTPGALVNEPWRDYRASFLSKDPP